MIEVRKGDIFLADLSTSIGLQQERLRPVLIVQNDIVNKYAPTTIVAVISTQIDKPKLPTHVVVSSEQSGLEKDSVVLLEQVRTIDKTRLKEKLGKVDEHIMTKLSSAWMAVGEVDVFVDELDNEEEDISKLYRFIIGEKINIVEDYYYEFKEIKGDNPVNSIKDTIAEYAAAFLNSKGGRILYGINDSGVVKGVRIGSQRKDEINCMIYSKLANIQPAVSPDYYEINYHPIADKDGIIIDDLFVIEICVPMIGDPSTVFYVNGNELYVRVKGVKKNLIGTEITSYIRRKFSEDVI